jgi:adhesin transport system membrane fusion protein
MYATTIEIEPQLTNTDGTEVAILPGMIAQADIIRGSRTILEYFWQPVAKIKDDAFRE